MNIEKILEYQNLDSQIHKLEQKLLSNPSQKTFSALQKERQETQNIALKLEKEAENA